MLLKDESACGSFEARKENNDLSFWPYFCKDWTRTEEDKISNGYIWFKISLLILFIDEDLDSIKKSFKAFNFFLS